jgi:hypothetical protein
MWIMPLIVMILSLFSSVALWNTDKTASAWALSSFIWSLCTLGWDLGWFTRE